MKVIEPITRGLLTLGVCLLLWNCEHKDLCYHHVHGIPVRLYVDWQNFEKEVPTGMSVFAYPHSGAMPAALQTYTLEYADLILKEDCYDFLAFNQSPSEFGTLSFHGLEVLGSATVEVQCSNRSWYSAQKGERVAGNLEWFASGTVEGVPVREEISSQWSGISQENMSAAICDTVFPLERIYTLNIVIHVRGMSNLAGVRGSIDGMAGGCRLCDGSALEWTVTHLLEEWRKSMIGDIDDSGMLLCSLTCFGLPDEHAASFKDNLLKISILLKDGKTILNEEFLVGNRFITRLDDHLELDLEIGTEEDGGAIILPDVEPDDTGGFDVDITDWCDPEEIEILM